MLDGEEVCTTYRIGLQLSSGVSVGAHGSTKTPLLTSGATPPQPPIYRQRCFVFFIRSERMTRDLQIFTPLLCRQIAP